MVLAVITILGRRFRLVLVPESSLPPATIETTAEPVEATEPAPSRPALRLVRSEAA